MSVLSHELQASWQANCSRQITCCLPGLSAVAILEAATCGCTPTSVQLSGLQERSHYYHHNQKQPEVRRGEQEKFARCRPLARRFAPTTPRLATNRGRRGPTTQKLLSLLCPLASSEEGCSTVVARTCNQRRGRTILVLDWQRHKRSDESVWSFWSFFFFLNNCCLLSS